MDSRRNFLRGLAQAVTAGRESAPAPPRAGGSPREPDAAGASSPSPEPPTGRHQIPLELPEWGPHAQETLAAASVLVVGAGGLGSPVASYLAGSGVGRLGIVDDGMVELSGLHRQTLHYTPDVGVPRAHSAAVKLGFLNPETLIEPYPVRLGEGNADGLLAGHDLVLDCSNAHETRIQLNRACCRAGVRLVTAWASGLRGAVLTVRPGETACATCLAVDEPAQDGATPLFGPVAGTLGSLQALAAMQLLGEMEAPPGGPLLEIDLRAPAMRRVHVVRRAGCPDCGDG